MFPFLTVSINKNYSFTDIMETSCHFITMCLYIGFVLTLLFLIFVVIEMGRG